MVQVITDHEKISCNFDKIETGEILAVTYYTKVKKKDGETLILEDLDRGTELSINGKDLIETMQSSSQYDTEEKVSLTRIVDILKHTKGSLFTVCYNKKVSENDVNEALSSINKGKILSNDEIKRTVKEAYKGEERILTGFLTFIESDFGRSHAIDLSISPEKNRVRQIDHRTINWLIVNNVKYYTK
jgi:hypothetical protein